LPATPITDLVRRAVLLTGLLVGLGPLAAPASAAPPAAASQTPVAAAQTPVAAAVTVAADGAKTRLAFTLSRPVTASAFVMQAPDRIVIDLPEVNFQLPAESGRRPEGLVSSFRYGLFAPGRSRIVIDLAQPALVSRIETETGLRDVAPVLVIELAKADRDAFRKAATAAGARASGPEPAVAAPEDARPLVVLDPGHGGIDPGATASGGLQEKDLVFGFAQRLRKKLEAGGRYRVRMTRDDDVFVALAERVRGARAARADLFISIHADTIAAGQEVRGLTVYTGSERASDAESARLADRENRADAVGGIEAKDAPEDVADILQELTLRETRAFSHRLATRLVGELEAVAQLNKNPHRQAGFRVLRAPDVPSVLVELGYLSSRKDMDLLLSESWRDQAADAMASAVDRFFAARLASHAAPVSP
jgi:N-acetylmuramoyl-L-alanine amidase